MVDMGEFDARRTARAGAEEQARVFAGHRARIAAMDRTIHDPHLLMQDTDRRLFGWFLSRVDAPWTLRRALGLTK
jgi:hypothetical protein